MAVETPLFHSTWERANREIHVATDRIQSLYSSLVTNGPLRASLLNIDSYRFPRDIGESLTDKRLDWQIAAGGVGTAFGLGAGLLLGTNPFVRHLAQTFSDLVGRMP